MTTGNKTVALPATILPCDLASLPEEETDVLVAGVGIAGLSVARELGGSRRILALGKGPEATGSTLLAQGGVAAALDPADSPAVHAEDTLAAGAGLCDPGAVSVLVEEAADAVAFLLGAGVHLDGNGEGPSLTIEGGHSHRRVVHAGGDATGVELLRALRSGERDVAADAFLVDLLVDHEGRIAGALVLVDGSPRVVRAGAVVLATGGCGRLYAATTSPLACTGDGTAAALRAGAAIADLEFVQFHPTALHAAADPRPLITESLRGEGAVLRDADGNPVMAGVHPAGDLAPRDVVSRAMVAAMREAKTDHLFLDATAVEVDLAKRFPTITAACHGIGVDPRTEWIPVSPTCHYTIGGVRTDPDGRASLPGLYAVGEAAAAGVHGANRLASNSLLEGVVFGRRIARAILAERPTRPAGQLRLAGAEGPTAPIKAAGVPRAERLDRLRHAMVEGAGVVRDAERLDGLASLLAQLGGSNGGAHPGDLELANLWLLATALVELALRREESRGAHFREDFPASEDAWRCHQLLTREPGGGWRIERAALRT